MSDEEKIRKIKNVFEQSNLTFDDDELTKDIMLLMSINTIYDVLDELKTLISQIKEVIYLE